MNTNNSQQPKNTLNTWLLFALGTVACWGVYGIFLHSGQMKMGDPENGRYKAFLLVGIAYFVVAIVGPALVIAAKGGNLKFWEYPGPGLKWSFIAGVVGALGAFFVLLAFGAKGSPPVVMAIVFAGAPIVNAIVHLIQHPPHGGWGNISPWFYLGIVMAAAGGCLVTFFKPGPPPPAKKAPVAQVQVMETKSYEIARHD